MAVGSVPRGWKNPMLPAVSTPRHPIFDPSTYYGQIRAYARIDLKMCGYCGMLWGRAEREHDPTPRSSPCEEQERRELAQALEGGVAPAQQGGARCGPTIQVLDALRVETAILDLGTAEARPPRYRGIAELCLVREADGSLTAGLLVWFDQREIEERLRIASSSCCLWRAYFFEPEAVARLERFLGDRPYLDAFDAEAVRDNLDVARMIGGAPEMEGVWSPRDGLVRFGRLPVTDRYVLLPPRREPPRIVVVFHPA
jgi:hypothetical protein